MGLKVVRGEWVDGEAGAIKPLISRAIRPLAITETYVKSAAIIALLLPPDKKKQLSQMNCTPVESASAS